jgi:hypothetical protein
MIKTYTSQAKFLSVRKVLAQVQDFVLFFLKSSNFADVMLNQLLCLTSFTVLSFKLFKFNNNFLYGILQGFTNKGRLTEHQLMT